MSVFWTRIGSATGEHESGSVEEIKRHVEARKPAMIYFSSQPVAPGSYDSSQYAQVQEFKAWCQEHGIVGSFDNILEFEEKLRRDLTLILRDNAYLRDQVGGAGISTAEREQPLPLRDLLLPEAAKMLQIAAKSRSGTILLLRHLNGTAFTVGDETLPHDGTQRGVASLEAAVEQLEDLGLIKDRGHKREVFQLTDQGYHAADELS